ncbi:MAG: alkaline phosphatase family protein, partial [Xanthomonadales bacterium]|nr:alkaline phosphatase family protein [Xanthomonadales bacterium]
EAWDREAAIERIKNRFGIEGKLIEQYAHPYLYLSSEVTGNSGIDRNALEAAIVNELSKFEGVSLAVSSAALREGDVPDTALYRSVLNNFHSKRSGDIYIVFEPNWFINDFDGLTVAATHGSPWQYDTYVPIVFAGAGLEPKTIDRRVFTTDIAPTLSAYLRIKPPSGAQGNVLREVLD